MESITKATEFFVIVAKKDLEKMMDVITQMLKEKIYAKIAEYIAQREMKQ